GAPVRVHVRVRATSANLGPGFDALGLALGLYNEVTAEEADTVTVTLEGEGVGRLPITPETVVVRGVRQAYDAAARPFRGVALTCVNRIPASRGLGSSAAAGAGAVGGVLRAAGPSVLAAALGDTTDVGRAMESALAAVGIPGRAQAFSVDTEGAVSRVI